MTDTGQPAARDPRLEVTQQDLLDIGCSFEELDLCGLAACDPTTADTDHERYYWTLRMLRVTNVFWRRLMAHLTPPEPPS